MCEVQEEEMEYEGIRLNVVAHMGSARFPVQVDIAFGDAIERPRRRAHLEVLLEFPAPHLMVYPWESVIAEKFQAIVELGMGNSRMKDFFDLNHLAGNLSLNGVKLSRAVAATFKRRRTKLPLKDPIGLTPEFIGDAVKQAQWRAFLRRIRQDSERLTLEVVVEKIRVFIMPLVEALASRKSFKKKWPKGGPWR